MNALSRALVWMKPLSGRIWGSSFLAPGCAALHPGYSCCLRLQPLCRQWPEPHWRSSRAGAGGGDAHHTPPVDDQVVESVRIGLRQFGYEDGRNIKLEVRSALGRPDRVPALAEELVRLRVDVIVLVNEVALRAVRQATATIPIVMVGYTDDPVDVGWIESYRRPGGNVTGIFNVNSAVAAKRLEILKETLPNVSRVAVLGTISGSASSRSCGERLSCSTCSSSLFRFKAQIISRLPSRAPDARKRVPCTSRGPPVFYVHRARSPRALSSQV